MMRASNRSGSRFPSRRQRGQATVETALGILVFVTVLMFGIHFAELSSLSLKVSEAQMFAVWDTTGRRLQKMPNDFGPRATARDNAGGIASGRYQDFDGRTASTGSSVTQVLTTSNGITVSCDNPNPALPDLTVPNLLETAYRNGPGGMECKASSTISVINMPTKYLEGAKGLFNAKNVSRTNYSICGIGRAWGGGGCQGTIAVLLGDWGLTDNDENKECELGPSRCSNGPYYDMVKGSFDKYGRGFGDFGSQLASLVVGSSPIDENQFWMSFRGDTSPNGAFKEKVPGQHSNDDGPEYTVTPGGDYEAVPEYQGTYGDRQDCFLGQACN